MSYTYEPLTPMHTPSSGRAVAQVSHSTNVTAEAQAEQVADIARVRQWCERLAEYYRLEPQQLDDLKQLANLMANIDEGLIKAILWSQTTIYRMLNRSAAQALEYQRFNATLSVVEDMLGTSWNPSKDQATTIRVIARDMLITHDQRSYMGVHLDVKDHLKENQVTLGFENIFDNPAREEKLMSVVRKKTSNGRTTFRELLILSIAGPGKKSLEDATWDIVNRLKKGGTGNNLSLKYQFRICMLRAWTYEEYFKGQLPHAAQTADHGSAESSPSPLAPSPTPTSEAEGPSSEPPFKKRKAAPEGAADKVLKATVGKVPKGEDFWSKIDARLDDLIAEWGPDMTTQVWRDHLTELVLRDRRLFGNCTSGVLPSIPVVPAGTIAAPLSGAPIAGPSTIGDVFYAPNTPVNSAQSAMTPQGAHVQSGTVGLNVHTAEAYLGAAHVQTSVSSARTSLWD